MMDGWIDGGWMDRWMSRWVDGWMGEKINNRKMSPWPQAFVVTGSVLN